MRIGISGTHCCGKTTLIEEFLLRHKDFKYEAEAYEVMQDELGESFAAQPSAEDFRRQLEYCAQNLSEYSEGDHVIFERCPADYLAYMFALQDLGRDSQAAQVAARSIGMARSAMMQLDLIVLVRLSEQDFDVPDEEDPELRMLVDERLESILINNELDLLPDHLLIVEASGSTLRRLEILEETLK